MKYEKGGKEDIIEFICKAIKSMDSEIADLRLKLKSCLDFQTTGFRKWKIGF